MKHLKKSVQEVPFPRNYDLQKDSRISFFDIDIRFRTIEEVVKGLKSMGVIFGAISNRVTSTITMKKHRIDKKKDKIGNEHLYNIDKKTKRTS